LSKCGIIYISRQLEESNILTIKEIKMTNEQLQVEEEFAKVESIRGFRENSPTREHVNTVADANESIYSRMYEHEVIEDLNHRLTEAEMKLYKWEKWAEKILRRMDHVETNAPKTSNNGTAWSFKETEFLLNNYTEFGPTELAEMWEEEFGRARTEKSISSKASKIKVKYGLSVQDKRDITKILEGSGIIHKKKAIELAKSLGVNVLKLVQYLQQSHKVGADEDGSYTTDLKDQWNIE